MIEEDYKPVYDEVNPENLIGVTIEKDGTLKDVEDVFDYDKDSETIQKEIEEFNKNGETEEAKKVLVLTILQKRKQIAKMLKAL